MKYLVLASVLIFVTVISAKSQFIIQTMSGDYAYGYITYEDSESIKVLNEDGVTLIISKDQIFDREKHHSKVRISSGRDVYAHISLINEDELVIESEEGFRIDISRSEVIYYKPFYYESHYFFVGPTISSEGTYNIIAGYNFAENSGIKASIGAFNNRFSFRGHLLYNLFKMPHFEHNVSMGGGYFRLFRDDCKYWGLFTDINLHGLFFEIGYTMDFGDVDKYDLLVNIGYVYRFND
jgi:hypothetical protein